MEEALLKGGEGKAKIGSPWTSLGVISHFSLSHIFKCARSVFPQSCNNLEPDQFSKDFLFEI